MDLRKIDYKFIVYTLYYVELNLIKINYFTYFCVLGFFFCSFEHQDLNFTHTCGVDKW